MKINRYLGLIIVCFLISNCSSDETTALIPEKALLISPAEDSPCLTGDSVSDTEIEVIFRWSPARNTDYYNLRITNLISNEIINKTNIENTGATVVLEKGKPYSWSVNSKSDLVDEVGTSKVNNFYVGGFESVTDAPVPVSLTHPDQGSNVIIGEGGKVSFSWSENSQNNSMKYTLYLDKIDGKQTPSLEHTDLTANTIDVTLENSSTYFWRVKSFDGVNSSFSIVNTFKTNVSGAESNTGAETNSSQEQVKEVSGNLVKNGTFETGNISPWGGFKNAVLSSSIQQPNTGQYLARIEPGDGSLYQIIYLQPGEIYRLKFSAKWKDTPDRKISVKLKNEEGDKAVFLDYEIFESTNWVEYDIEFTVPDGVNIARLLFYKSQTNPILPSLFLDDFVIQKK